MLNRLSNYITSKSLPAGRLAIGQIFNLGRKTVAWKKVNELKPGMKIAIADSGVEWDEIVSIKSVGQEQVYDIEVEGTHNFVGNGIIAHNTYISGNLGIGTTSPAATSILDLTSTTKGFLAPRMTTTQRDAISTPATGLFIYNTTTNAYNVYNGSTWGAVGGGGGGSWSDLTLPTANLSLAMSAYTSTFTYSATTGAGVNLFNLTDTASNTGTGYMLNLSTGNSSALNPFRVVAANGVEALMVKSNGNVGIGTTTPSQTLDVNGIINVATGFKIANGSATSGHYLRGDGTNYIDGTIQISDLPTIAAGGGWTDSGATIYLTTSADNVGIGTSSPVNKLDVVGSLAVGSTVLAAALPQAGSAYFAANVGIGTTSPTSMLSVGSTSQFQVNSSGAIAAATGIVSSGNIDLSSLGAGGIIKAAVTSGRLSIATAGTDYENPLTFSNGLTRTVNAVKLGGTLTASTDIPLGSYNLTFSGTGNVGIGTTGPVSLLEISHATAATMDIHSNREISGDLATLRFSAVGYTGDSYRKAAIYFQSDGTGYGKGNMLFAVDGAADTLNVGVSDTVMAITNTGNVGIGTTSPSKKLEVAGDIALSAQGKIGQGHNYGTTANSNNGTLELYNSATGNTTLWNDGYDIIFGAANAEVMRIKSGNVGIGTTSPGTLLQVVGSANRLLRLGDGTGTGSKYALIDNGTGSAYFGAEGSVAGTTFTNTTAYSAFFIQGGAKDLQFGTNSAVNVTIQNGGNVGIGTTGPGANLDIQRVFGDDSDILRIGSNQGYYFGFARNNSTGALSIQGNQVGNNNIVLAPTSGNVGIGTTGPQAKLEVAGVSSAPLATGPTSGGILKIYATDSTESLTIGALTASPYSSWIQTHDQSSNYYPLALNPLGGNVGIGTTNPGALLHLSKSIATAYSSSDFDQNYTLMNIFNPDTTVGSAAGINFQVGTNREAAIGVTATADGAAALTFGTRGGGVRTEKMRIDSTGNVGIGTTGPGDKLAVSSTDYRISVNNSADTDGPGSVWGTFSSIGQVKNPGYTMGGGTLGLTNVMNSDYAFFGLTGTNDDSDAIINWGDDTNSLLFKYDNTELARITSTGNVGIGTTGPGAKLNVSGGDFYVDNTAPEIRLRPTADTNNFLKIVQDTARSSIQNNYNYPLALQPSGGNVGIGTLNPGTAGLAVMNGNVGIGTTAPANLLTLAPGATARTLMIQRQSVATAGLLIGMDSDANARFKVNNADTTFGVGNNDNDSPSWTEYMRIKNGGNVGIGTTGPGYKLQVVGNILAGASGTDAEYRLGSSGSGGFERRALWSSGTELGIGHGDAWDHIAFLPGSTEKVRITNAGNVGIGTTTPASYLSIANPVGTNKYTDINLDNANTAYASRVTYSESGVPKANIGWHNSAWGAGHQEMLTIESVSDPITFWMNNTEAMRISSLGNVGIGTTNPSVKLETAGVNGSTALRVNYAAGSGNYLDMNFNTINSVGGNNLKLYDSSAGIDIKVGNVGIGTTNPGATLDIVSAVTTGTGEQLTANSITSGTGLNLSSTLVATTFTGKLANIDWSPTGSTNILNTGDLLRINTGQYAQGVNLLNITDNGSSIFSVNQTAITAGVPTNFTSAGDVSVAYDISFTNQTASMIGSYGPLSIKSGEIFESNDLTLQTYNSGNIILNSTNLWADGSNVGIGITSPSALLHLGIGSTAMIGQKITLASGATANAFEVNSSSGAGGDKFVIKAGGNVGIGTSAPGAQLDLSTDSARKLTTTTWATGSDARIKTNVQSIGDALDIIRSVRPVKFHYTADYMAKHPSIIDTNYYNFIAQEFQQIFPNSVTETDGLLYLNSSNMIPYAISGIKELDAKEASLSGQIAALSAQMNGLNLTSTGDLVINQNAQGDYDVVNTNSQTITDRISVFASSFIANLTAGVVNTQKLFTNELISPIAEIDTLRVKDNLLSPLATIDTIYSSNASISGTLYASEISSPTIDALDSKFQILDSNYATASAILAAIKAKYADYASLNNPNGANDPLSTTDLSGQNATISGEMALYNQPVIITDTLLVNTSLISNSINSNDTALYIQPTANQPLNLLAGLMILTPDGKVAINGDLTVTGTIAAKTLSGVEGQITNLKSQMATISGTLTANQAIISDLIIASAATESASASSSASLASNATIGTGIIAAGTTELRIENSKIENSTYVYLTPISDTANQVVFVKSKSICDKNHPEPVEGSLCIPSFTVAIYDALAKDITFNYWLIQSQP